MVNGVNVKAKVAGEWRWVCYYYSIDQRCPFDILAVRIKCDRSRHIMDPGIFLELEGSPTKVIVIYFNQYNGIQLKCDSTIGEAKILAEFTPPFHSLSHVYPLGLHDFD